jgi:SAM-dependent methyltransferase
MRFDRATRAYDEYLSSPLGKLRDELAWHWLAEALQGSSGALNVVDVGCGPGLLGLRLAEAGHRVCLLDPSPNMLALARARAEMLPRVVRERLRYCQADLEEFASSGANAPFDLVLAHVVVEYLPSPDAALSSLAALLRPGGLLSLVFANRDAEPLRRALLRRQAEEVRAALTADLFPEQLFGLQRRMLAPVWVQEQLELMGMAVVAEHGIRVFADYLLDDESESKRSNLTAIYGLELEAADLFPWKYVARYVHTLSRR